MYGKKAVNTATANVFDSINQQRSIGTGIGNCQEVFALGVLESKRAQIGRALGPLMSHRPRMQDAVEAFAWRGTTGKA
jgi:hypothetical protein